MKSSVHMHVSCSRDANRVQTVSNHRSRQLTGGAFRVRYLALVVVAKDSSTVPTKMPLPPGS